MYALLLTLIYIVCFSLAYFIFKPLFYILCVIGVLLCVGLVICHIKLSKNPHYIEIMKDAEKYNFHNCPKKPTRFW
jgi:uncharacterized membrane protein